MHREGVWVFLSLSLSPHSTSPFKVLVYLPCTLVRACCFTYSTEKALCCLLVALWRLTRFFYQSFTFLFLCVLYFYAKIAKHLIHHISQLCLFFLITTLAAHFWMLPYFPLLTVSPVLPLGSTELHLAHVSKVDVPGGCRLDGPVTALTAGETGINILPLSSPLLISGRTQWCAREGETACEDVRRRAKQREERKSEVRPTILQSCLIYKPIGF